MSRIYEALKQIESPVVRMIEGEQAGQSAGGDDSIEAVSVIERDVYEHWRVEEPAALPEEEMQEASVRAGVSASGYRISKIRAGSRQPVLPFDGSDARTAECYRILRTKILHLPAQPKVIAISSAMPKDGKTTSAINLAGALALNYGIRVLLVDADLRRGSVAPTLGLDATPGIAEVLIGQCSLSEAIVQTETLANLHVLPTGHVSTNPAEMLGSPAWRSMFQELRNQFEFIIVDTTPIGVVADYELVQEVCDGTIVVVRPDYTDRRTCVKALQAVGKGKLLGTILNCAHDWFLWRIRDYYGYYGKSK